MRKATGRIHRWLAAAAMVALVLCAMPSASGRQLPGPAHAQKRSHTPRTALHVPHRAILYQRAGYILELVGILWNVAGLWLILATGLSGAIRTLSYRLVRLQPPANGPPPFPAVLVYYTAFSIAAGLWGAPPIVGSWLLERRFGFSTQSLAGLAGDAALGLLLGLPMAPVIWLAYRLFSARPKSWWRDLLAILALLLLLRIVLAPVLVAPLFNHYTPLPPGKLRSDIAGLADRAGISNAAILVEDTSKRTTHVNAYVTGLGPTTRIVINDTALRLLPEDEVLAMVGHEMGHYVGEDVWIRYLSAVLGAAAFLRIAASALPALQRRFSVRWHIQSLTDIASLPMALLLLSLFLLLQDPIENSESRYLEHRADAYGLRLTGLNNAMIRLFIGFAVRDYSDPNPPALLQFWFYSHPPLSERIDFAGKYHPTR